MQKLKHVQAIPIGGSFTLNLPDKGIVGYGLNFQRLVRSVTEYRHANAIPCGLGLNDEIERAVCEQYPLECHEADPAIPKRQTRMSYREMLHGTQVMLQHKLQGSPLVPLEEAERRAAICAVCPYNTEVQLPCGGKCGALKALVAAWIGTRHTQYDSRLKSCGICKCYLEASVHVPLEIQCVGVDEDQRAQFKYVREVEKRACWKQC